MCSLSPPKDERAKDIGNGQPGLLEGTSGVMYLTVILGVDARSNIVCHDCFCGYSGMARLLCLHMYSGF